MPLTPATISVNSLCRPSYFLGKQSPNGPNTEWTGPPAFATFPIQSVTIFVHESISSSPDTSARTDQSCLPGNKAVWVRHPPLQNPFAPKQMSRCQLCIGKRPIPYQLYAS